MKHVPEFPSILPVSAHAFDAEPESVAGLLEQVSNFRHRKAAIESRARRYVDAVRAAPNLSAFAVFQREFNLSSQEGILLMCLAEALLRIPDAATADRLIHDKIIPGDWDAHIGLGRSWKINAASYALELTGKLLQTSAGEFVGGLLHRLGEPVVRAALTQAMELMGQVFVFGDTIGSARRQAESWHEKGYAVSYDMLGEGARTAAQAEHFFEAYREGLRALTPAHEQPQRNDGISIKLSALHPRFELRQWDRVHDELLPRLKTLALLAAEKKAFLTIDAEEANRLDLTLMVIEGLYRDPELQGDAVLGLAVQAYQKRALPVIALLKSLAVQHGIRIPIRLVKGAYWDSEIKRAQADGLPGYPVFTRKYHTDVSYLACAEALLAAPQAFYPQFATHNALTAAAIIERAGEAEYEFQRLHGMGEELHDALIRDTGRISRIYAPVGPPEHLLSYLIRRILENGANSSFVHGLSDAEVSVESLVADPIRRSELSKGAAAEEIVLPKHLFPDRANSAGMDAGYLHHLHQLGVSFETPLPAAPVDATAEQCHAAFERASRFWGETRVEVRAECLSRYADLLEAHRSELIALMIQEAGKTLADAVAEVREAADFCRYYANEAIRIFAPVPLPGTTGERNLLCLEPRGVWVAISPWNFPLAIFTGQVVAALVTGNHVIAKPAEQTPRIAARAVELMHEAGIPADALQLLTGPGEVVGQALVRHASAAGVVFTGSTEAAKAIQRSLAEGDGPIVPLIAETGGQNCMIVDSSALIEQAVDDIILSAFGSAGQRCSALRVAFVQEEIAPKLIDVLAGAVRELRVGDPRDLRTDVGPVIDASAQAMLEAHRERMRRDARLIAQAPLADDLPNLCAPSLFEIDSLTMLHREVFGPMLHLIRYSESRLDEVIDEINATGYALTLGIQSRIDARIRQITSRVRAGNVYINRSMIGAVVGSQPFGGYGLSGTGPKAGGPHYLPRFCIERTITTNTAAIGGNVELLG